MGGSWTLGDVWSNESDVSVVCQEDEELRKSTSAGLDSEANAVPAGGPRVPLISVTCTSFCVLRSSLCYVTFYVLFNFFILFSAFCFYAPAVQSRFFFVFFVFSVRGKLTQ
jgi:hypothetical protein